MKHITKSSLKLSFLMLMSFSLLLSCSKDDEGLSLPPLSPVQQRVVDIAGTSEDGSTYSATSVLLDGVAAEGFDDFSITFRLATATNPYSSVSGTPAFRAFGTWNLNSLTELVIDDETTFTITSFDANRGELVITGDVTAGPSSAANGSGTYLFNLRKN